MPGRALERGEIESPVLIAREDELAHAVAQPADAVVEDEMLSVPGVGGFGR